MDERVEEIRRCFTEKLKRQVVNIRIEHIEEQRQPHFRDFQDVLLYADRKDHYCDICCFHKFCVLGIGQFLACSAHFSFTNADEETRTFYTNYPLTLKSIAQLDRKGLLAVYYFQKYNIRTMTDYSMSGLRKRLVEILQENSPYLLTTP